MGEAKQIVDEIIKDLDRIPKTVVTDIVVKEVIKQINEEMKNNNRRYNSYV